MNPLPSTNKLAEECAAAFSISTGLGCTVSDVQGTILFEQGYGCGTCGLCQAAGRSNENCINSHHYGMMEAERFGGKYIYFCPLGLTCFESPTLEEGGTTAKITVGPFLMVDRQDFIDCELAESLELTEISRNRVLTLLENIPVIPPEKVQQLSALLYMAVGFMNNYSSENRLPDPERSDLLQGQLYSYIEGLKQRKNVPMRYPFEKERELLQAISQFDKSRVHGCLQELLGFLLAGRGGNPDWIRTRLCELIVVISRTAIENGADEEQTLFFVQRCQTTIPTMKDSWALSNWLFTAITGFLDNLLAYPDAKHAHLIHQCIQYINSNYASPLTLEDTARIVNLSPDYLSKIFKQETGTTFSRYLNDVRIARAKELIRQSRLRLTDISSMVGYDDQSYFTKVFTRTVGSSPSEFRKKSRPAAN